MIFIDCTTEDWLIRYPELEPITGKCDNCNQVLVANRPIVTKGYAGLRSSDCGCGKGTNAVMSLVTTSEDECEEWNSIFGLRDIT